MYLKDFINQILSISEIDKKIDSAFLERLAISKQLLEGTSVKDRSSRSPFFLNDLGVRFTASPKEYAEWNVKKINVKIPSHNKLVLDLLQTKIELLPYVMDACVLLTGDFDAVLEVASKRKSEILEDGTYKTLIYSGTAFASKGSEDSYLFFSKAIHKSKDISRVITAYHRLIITKLKRFHDYEGAQKLLYTLVSEKIPESEDKDLYMALFDNMLGLAIVMEPNNFSLVTAKTLLMNAAERLDKYTATCSSRNKKSQAERYKGQVAINLVQLEIQKHNYKLANQVAINNLEHVKKHSKGYVAEAYSVLAYTQFLLKEYTSSLKTAKNALNEHVSIGNYDGVKASREMIISCYMKLNMKNAAKAEAQLILNKSFKKETTESKN
ncbi:hypothetical protein [uncultured Lactobacillus sp.]|uniref:hypothetical protein n=1 Tax=uncultured Lactobacillus sp. TaxID=153152 RepID=UPI00259BE928|nr:hypothetical protein [uncultured Lactobacillus sp.]